MANGSNRKTSTMLQSSTLAIVLTAIVATISVDGFCIPTATRQKSSTVRFSNDLSLLSLSAQSAPILGTSNERNDLTSNISLFDDTIQEILDAARRLGPVGVRNNAQDQEYIQQLVTKLKQQLERDRDTAGNNNYTDVPLVGIHDLIYSAAKGGSSGKIGPCFHGKVTQTFVNETAFMNAVDFGPLNIALTATRHVKDSTTFVVKFQTTTISLFGIPLIEKSIRGTGGVWKLLYTGIVHDQNINMNDGKKKRILLRIMETPSLFIIEQDLSHVA